MIIAVYLGANIASLVFLRLLGIPAVE